MSILKIFLLGLTLLSALGVIVFAQETPAGMGGGYSPVITEAIEESVKLDEDIEPKDLGISEPRLLPDSPFYFLKTWLRGIKLAFAFDPLKKAELRMKFANEKLVEIKKIVEKTKNPEIIKKLTENYQKEIEKIKEQVDEIKEKTKENPRVESFLDKFIHQQILHQKLLQRLENQVPPEAFEKIKETREKHLERFQEVMLKLEDRKEKIEKLENILKTLKGVLCGGWDTFGDVVCECKGRLEKFVCPPKTTCDSGTNICYGECGECKCYQGPAKDKREIPCDGRDKFFKGQIIITPPSQQVPTEKAKPIGACITLWDPVCGKDGKTYSNECFAKVAGVEIEYKGICKEKSLKCITNGDCPKTECVIGEACEYYECLEGACVSNKKIEGMLKECQWTMERDFPGICEKMIGKCYYLQISERAGKILCPTKEQGEKLKNFLNKKVVLKGIEEKKKTTTMCPCLLEYKEIEERE